MSATPAGEGKQHIAYFDFLRFIAMFSVIFMHTAAGLLRVEVNFQWGLLNLCTSFAFTAVPLFLMMSGYLLLSSKKTADIGVLFQKRLPRLLLPLAFWTVIEALRLLALEDEPTLRRFLSSIARSFREPLAVHFWYMYLVIALYLISPFLYAAVHALDRRGHVYLLALIGIITLQAMAAAILPERFDKFISFDFISKLKLFGGQLCAFFLGYYLGQMERKIPNRVLFPVTLALLATITAGTYVLTVNNGAYTPTFQTQSEGFEVALAACLFLLFKQNAGKPAPFFRAVPMVPLSLPIYLMHNILLSTLQTAGMYPKDFLSTLGMTALNLIVCFLAIKTAATLKPVCYLVTGMTYQDACESCNWVYTYRRLTGRAR